MLLCYCTMSTSCRPPAEVQQGWAGLGCHLDAVAHDVQGYMVSKAANDESFRIIERSNFTLAPRGHGSSSWRMCGSVLS